MLQPLPPNQGQGQGQPTECCPNHIPLPLPLPRPARNLAPTCFLPTRASGDGRECYAEGVRPQPRQWGREQAENDFLASEGTPRGVFAYDGFAQSGASDQATQGMWLWFDGAQFWQGASNGMPVGGLYAHWASASPSGNGNKPCSGMLSVGTWQDRSCTALDSFICEAP